MDLSATCGINIYCFAMLYRGTIAVNILDVASMGIAKQVLRREERFHPRRSLRFDVREALLSLKSICTGALFRSMSIFVFHIAA